MMKTRQPAVLLRLPAKVKLDTANKLDKLRNLNEKAPLLSSEANSENGHNEVKQKRKSQVFAWMLHMGSNVPLSSY